MQVKWHILLSYLSRIIKSKCGIGTLQEVDVIPQVSYFTPILVESFVIVTWLKSLNCREIGDVQADNKAPLPLTPYKLIHPRCCIFTIKPYRKCSVTRIDQRYWNIKPWEDTCKCTWNVLFIIFENIYNYLRQKKKVTNRIDLQFASIFKMLHK